MKTPAKKVLFLCTGNSARSIIAEYLLRAKGQERFETFSAGARPSGKVHPLAIWVLRRHYLIDASAARSKSWDEYRKVEFDFVVTVCDHARETCPIWPGQPVVAHWGSPDPAAFEGTEEEKQRFFHAVASQISRRLDLFCALPDEKLSALKVRQIGEQYEIKNEGAPAH
jgi:arsenate reductase (thioredoxin)